MDLYLSEINIYIGVRHESLKDEYVFWMIKRTLKCINALIFNKKERALMLYSLSRVMKFSRQSAVYLSAIVAL